MTRIIQAAAVAAALLSGRGPSRAQTPPPPPTPMSLTSPSFSDGGIIPNKYSQVDAAAVSPAFAWANAPATTVSFAIIMHDVDSMPRKGFPDNLHWMLFNIPPTVRALPEGLPPTQQLPDGTIQTLNGSHKPGYLPLGARIVYHHYVVELFALDTKLAIGPDATRADVLAALDGHVIGKAAYVGRFHR